jgi:hypothetical protein
VTDPITLETSLDEIVFGGNKISVNLSRFNRSDNRHTSFNKKRNGSHHDVPNALPSSSIKPGTEVNSFAQVVKRGVFARLGEGSKHINLSYEAEKHDLLKLKKAFVGEVKQPGMTYRIQNAFHMQGYFGVKVTPLGSTLTLLEEQEEGEIQALMMDAKEWLDDWFQEIRPWNPKEIDRDRIIWLRIYGIPAHAWNDQFFAQVSKPWGTFMNTDDVTSKKLSMDVARVMIRSSCQIVVDEFLDVKINGDIFRIRVLEDSYGPMRIPLPQGHRKAGKANSEDEDDEVDEEEEEEEEEEAERLLKAGEEGKERESEGEGENLWAFNSLDNTHNESTNNLANNAEIIKEKEIRVEDSFISNNGVGSPLTEEGGFANLEGGTAQQDSLNVKGGHLLGQEGCVVGPAKSTCLHHTIAGGVDRRLTQSENLGCVQKPNLLMVRESGGKGELKGGVYSDGPRSVYKKLNLDPKNNSNFLKKKNSLPKDPSRASLLPSASLRTQHRMAQALGNKSRKSQSTSSSSFVRPTQFPDEET